jgi:hypothetical protein
MLGENIVPDEKGKVVGARVLPGVGQGPNGLELTFQSTGTILGAKFANTGTVVSRPKAENTLSAEGQGIAMLEEGGMVSWTFQGISIPGAGGAGRFRGMTMFQSAPAKLSRLVGMCAVVEGETDATQNISVKLWEWK